MIDIENKVLNDVFTAVRSAYPDCQCYGEYVSVPAAFPCICIYEASNSTYRRSQDTDLQEHQANLMYECNVYSRLNKLRMRIDMLDQSVSVLTHLKEVSLL